MSRARDARRRGTAPLRAALALAVATVVAVRAAQEEQPAGAQDARIAALERELAELRAENQRLRARVEGLQRELALMTEDAFGREQQWLDFTRVVASLSSDRLSPDELARVLGGPPRTEEPAPADERPLLQKVLEDQAAGAAQVAPASDATGEALRARSEETARALRSLLVAEQVEGLELLEAGLLGGGATGPVVFRQTDAWGRPVGTLSADRLRLEGSRAGRTTTLVLEHGCERRGGERRAFEGAEEGAELGGARRIVLAGVYPGPWIEALPELFTADARVEVDDDGRWNRALVQLGLNELLRLDAAAGYYRLAALAGVVDGELCDVRLEELTPDGRVQRLLFADRLRIDLQERGVLLSLEDGVQMRAGRRLPFLEGRYRIFLPRAAHAEWKELGLPGLVPAKDSPLAYGSEAPLPALLSGNAQR